MTALQQGTVDAVENSFFNLATRGFIDMCPYVLAINFIYSSRSIICNAEWFDALSAEDQELVRQCAQEAADWANEQTLAEYEQYVNDERWTVYELSDEQYEVFQASAEKLWEGARNDCDPAILDALTAGKE
jgi:TRAP-type C4-dicarboxylate transport system substrate-binding protein